MQKSNYSSIETIIKIAKRGGMFILVDDEKRENEGDLVISTSDTNSKNINFMAKYGRGLICLALDSLQAKRLNLSLMSPINKSRNQTAFTISIEAKRGITTGISENIYYNSGFKAIANDVSTVYQQDSGNHQFYTGASASADAAVTLTERVRIDPDGHVAFKTTDLGYPDSGDDLTIVTYGMGVIWSVDAMEDFQGKTADIIDLRTLQPWDKDAVADSVEKTNKVIIIHEDTVDITILKFDLAIFRRESVILSKAPIASIDPPKTIAQIMNLHCHYQKHL